MKASTLFGGVPTALLAGFLLAQGAPVDAIAPRDFSADLRNFSQVQLILHNLRSRIGIPVTAMRNVGLNFNHTLEVKPFDLVLLPSGYCFSCSIFPQSGPDFAKRPKLFRNEMVEVDESQLLIACTDDPAGGKAGEWPLMGACPGQEEVLRTFFLDVCSHGSRIAIPKTRLENAPVFEVGKHVCMPEDTERMSCSISPSFTAAPSTGLSSSFKTSYAEIALLGRLIDLKAYISSIYQQKTLPNTKLSMASSTTATTNVITAPTISGPSVAKPDATPAPSSMIPPSNNHIEQQTIMKPEPTFSTSSSVPSITKPTKRPRSTSFEEEWPIPPTYTSPVSANDGNNRFAAMYSFKSKEQAEVASRSSALGAANSARGISAPTPQVVVKGRGMAEPQVVDAGCQPTKTAVVMMQTMKSMQTTSHANDADPSLTNGDVSKHGEGATSNAVSKLLTLDARVAMHGTISNLN
jgi:hypothetical protein